MDDALRRLELRAFLIAARARLTPAHVGLPATERRRVPGLRREEVAELAGVTPVWYRWFESGRDVRVSAQFIERLCVALRLSAADEVALYRFALPGLYRAANALSGAAGDAPGGGASPLANSAVAEIDAAADSFDVGRELFSHGAGSRVKRTRS